MKPHSLDVSITVASVNQTAVCLVNGVATVDDNDTHFLRGDEEIIATVQQMSPDEVAHLWQALDRLQCQVCVVLHEKTKI